MHPKNISIQDFSYPLPEEKIALYPLAQRDDSRLLIYRNGLITEDVFSHICGQLPADGLLIFNNSKVLEARILFQKPSGGQIEIFCLEPHENFPEFSAALLQQEKVRWNCLVGGASKWKKGQVLEKKLSGTAGEISLVATCIKKSASDFVVEFCWLPGDIPFVDVLHLAGQVPLPPYIKRAPEATDANRYQTIYASRSGSVAAPTAGLHFSDAIFQQMAAAGIDKAFVGLHVGAGTFKPVASQTLGDHPMHQEYFEVTLDFMEQLLGHFGHPVIPVGTTSLRTIESLYWMGVKILMNQDISLQQLAIRQWDSYEIAAESISPELALRALHGWLKEQGLDKLMGSTQLLIAPGYRFRLADGLVTNFHQPQSTLLLLVAALIGPDWKAVYHYALENHFRFLSYGDCSLLFKNSQAFW
jgi:S-adenosylmethionine:tRNA ribosyltransferase-isomerase